MAAKADNFRFCTLLILAALALTLHAFRLSANVIFVGNKHAVAQYTTAGNAVNESLITGLKLSSGIAVAGRYVFVADENSGTIGKYTRSGRIVNATLISGLRGPAGIAVAGHRLFVADYRSDTIGEYTTAGHMIRAALISGLCCVSIEMSPPCFNRNVTSLAG